MGNRETVNRRLNCLSHDSLPTETQVESGTSQSKNGTSVNLSNSGLWQVPSVPVRVDGHHRDRFHPRHRRRLHHPGRGPWYALPTPYTLHPLHHTPSTPYTLYTIQPLHPTPPTPYTHPTPYTFYILHPLQTPYTLYTLHPTHPTPHIHPTPSTPYTPYTLYTRHPTPPTPDTHPSPSTPYTPTPYTPYTLPTSDRKIFDLP